MQDEDSFFTCGLLVDWLPTNLPTFYCEFNYEKYSDDLFRLYGLAFPHSVQRAVVKRRAEFLAGRYCAGRSLFECGVEGVTIKIGHHRNPEWPEGALGSISHSNGSAIAITGNNKDRFGVGIDIENKLSLETSNKLRDLVLDQSEIALVSSDTTQTALLFTLCFSVKESFFKAAYPTVGRYFDFHVVSVVEIDADRHEITLQLNETLNTWLTKKSLFKCYFYHISEKSIVTLVELKR